MDALIARYIELGDESKEARRKLGMMNREKKVVEDKIQESLRATGHTEILANDNSVCIRLKERIRKRGPTRDEMIENIHEETGYFYDSDKLEGMKKETKVMNLQILNKRPARG
eukprot:gene12737-15983_t